jgi:penicillin-binding protein 2
VLLLFAVLIGNLFGLMILRHKVWQDQALENRQVRFRVKAPRGRIVDRDGAVLADNMYIADITVPARALADGKPDSSLHRLLTWFALPRAETIERLVQQQSRGQSELVVVAGASLPQIVTVEERERQLPGVRVEARQRRRYLHGPLFTHVIGHLGEVGPADIDSARSALAYWLGDQKGKIGVEARYEATLRGQNGLKLEEVNASGRVVGRETVWLERVVPGSDICLALSLPLQRTMAELLAGRVGCGVALELSSGEVLAAYSSPSYDPNLLTGSLSTAAWAELTYDPAKPFFNRIVQASYPPASLYKSVTALAALREGVIGIHTELEPCSGAYTFGNRSFRCWKRWGHGTLDLTGALVHSCDVYFYQLGLRLTIDQMAQAAYDFGLGTVLTDLFPEETAGIVPTSSWYDRRFGKGNWTRGVLLNNAIGQGELLVTPLQMVMLAARIATSGRVAGPTFVRVPGAVFEEPGELPFDPRHLSWCRRGLEQVVDAGTGMAARLAGIGVAGKTGTAQNPHGEDHAWFMCYAPTDTPEVALAIIVENAGHGGSESAPLAGRWLHAYFESTGRFAPPVAEADSTSGTGA